MHLGLLLVGAKFIFANISQKPHEINEILSHWEVPKNFYIYAPLAVSNQPYWPNFSAGRSRMECALIKLGT